MSTAVRSSTYLTLSWDKVSGASGYRIYRYNTDAQAYEKVITLTSGSTVSYKITGLAAAKEYQFKVRAYRKVDGVTTWGSSSAAYKDSTKPGQTKSLKASSKSSAVTLKWNKVTRASGYQVYRYNSKTKKYEKLATVKGNATFSYKNTKLKKGTTVKYKVRAYKTYNGTNYYGAFSDIVSIKVK